MFINSIYIYFTIQTASADVSHLCCCVLVCCHQLYPSTVCRNQRLTPILHFSDFIGILHNQIGVGKFLNPKHDTSSQFTKTHNPLPTPTIPPFTSQISSRLLPSCRNVLARTPHPRRPSSLDVAARTRTEYRARQRQDCECRVIQLSMGILNCSGAADARQQCSAG